MMELKSKIKTFEEIKKISEELKKDGKKVVTTNGAFDILHKGHVLGFYEAKKQGDVLIVGLNSDSSVRENKGPNRPINSEEERAFVLSALEIIDYIVIFRERLPINFLEAVKPDVHCKGGDYAKETMPEWEVVEKNGGKVHFLKFHEGHSTTKIIEKMK